MTVLVDNQAGYRNLCRLLTTAARGRPKGEARVSWDLLAEHAGGLHCLTGGEEGPLARELSEGGIDPARRLLERLSGYFPRPPSRRAATPSSARGGAPEPGAGRSRPPAAPPAPCHQRCALRPSGGQAAARRPDRHPPPHHARRGRPPPGRPPRAASQEPGGDGPPLLRPAPGGVGERRAGRLASTSPWRTSATASPNTRCRRARRRPPTCATSPGTAPAPASGRSPPRPRRRSRKSST